MITSTEIEEVAREIVDTPWVHQARLPGIGVDCIGLLVHVAKRLNIPHTDYTAYSRHPIPEEFIQRLEQSGALIRTPVKIPIVGMVAVIWIRHENEPTHVGIFTSKGIIHTYQSIGRVCEHALTDFWRGRIHSIWSFVGWQPSSSELQAVPLAGLSD